jgi:hypothetical protein
VTSLTPEQAQALALAAEEKKQDSIEAACLEQVNVAARAGLYVTEVDYDLSGEAGYQLGLAGYLVTALDDSRYTLSWVSDPPPPTPPSPIPWVWPVTAGGTGLDTVALGDLLYGSAVDELSSLAIGANGRVLQVVAGLPAWDLISYPSLDLTDSIMNADINSAAAIDYSKLELTGAIVDADLFGGITAAKLAGSIPYSKLILTGAVVDADLAGGITAAKLAGSIPASKLVGSDIATVGTVTTGTWNAGVIGPAYGGTGVANDVAATLTRTGAHALTLTTTGVTSLTLPTSGTLATTFAASSVICDTGNGYGSTLNNRIRRFTNAATVGTDITYTDSATDGASFTINTAGIYSIFHSDASSSASVPIIGISKNSNQLTTAIQSITTAHRIAVHTGPGSLSQAIAVSVTTRLSASDVIRCHSNAIPNGAFAFTQFRIERIG